VREHDAIGSGQRFGLKEANPRQFSDTPLLINGNFLNPGVWVAGIVSSRNDA